MGQESFLQQQSVGPSVLRLPGHLTSASLVGFERVLAEGHMQGSWALGHAWAVIKVKCRWSCGATFI